MCAWLLPAQRGPPSNTPWTAKPHLRENRSGDAYSIDGGRWVSGTMLAFDANDDPLTEESPPIRNFKARLPNLAIWLVTVGLARADQRRR